MFNLTNLLILAVVLVLIFFVVRYFKNRQTPPDTQLQDKLAQLPATYPHTLINSTTSKSVETSQQGEEEIQQVLPQVKNDFEYKMGQDYDLDKAFTQADTQPTGFSTESTTTSHQLAAGISDLYAQDFKPKTLEEKLAFTYYFHSKPFANARRYSAAGKFVKVEVSEEYPAGYKLQVGYAVVGDTPDKETKKLDKFSRVEGRRIAEAKLADDSKVYDFPVTEEELQVPGRTFGDIVKSNVPFTVLNPEDRHEIRAWYTKKENYNLPTDATQEEQDDLTDYVEKFKKADYKHLVAQVSVSQCALCGEFVLDLEGVELFIYVPKDELVEETQTPPVVALPEGDTEFTNVEGDTVVKVGENPLYDEVDFPTPEEGAVAQEEK